MIKRKKATDKRGLETLARFIWKKDQVQKLFFDVNQAQNHSLTLEAGGIDFNDSDTENSFII